MKRWLVVLALLAAACRRDMADRPAQRPLGSSPFFADRSASRPIVADTVPRVIPAASAIVSIERGKQRYAIYCAPCHGRDGAGDGVIVQHGFPRPPDIRNEDADDVVNAIAFGKGAMYSYADRVPDSDRLAIAAYIRAMQERR